MNCVDTSQRRATWDIYISSQEYNWVLTSWQYTELNGRQEPFANHLNSSGLKGQIESSNGVIVIGAASEEGNDIDEYDRAERRAKQLIKWVREAVVTRIPLYRLTVGKHADSARSNPSRGTADQRSIVVISIIEMQDGFDLEGALRESLMTKDLPFQIPNYPRFDLKKVS